MFGVSGSFWFMMDGECYSPQTKHQNALKEQPLKHCQGYDPNYWTHMWHSEDHFLPGIIQTFTLCMVIFSCRFRLIWSFSSPMEELSDWNCSSSSSDIFLSESDMWWWKKKYYISSTITHRINFWRYHINAGLSSGKNKSEIILWKICFNLLVIWWLEIQAILKINHHLKLRILIFFSTGWSLSAGKAEIQTRCSSNTNTSSNFTVMLRNCMETWGISLPFVALVDERE